MQKVMNQALLDFYIRRFNREIKSPKDIQRVLFPNLTAKERKEMEPLFSEIKTIPHISRTDETIVFHYGDFDAHLKWPDLTKNQVYIEGVAWVFDPSAPLRFQFDNFKAKLARLSKEEKEASYFQLFPTANANPLVLGTKICSRINGCMLLISATAGAVLGNFAGKIASTIGTTTYDLACFAISPIKPWSAMGWCRDWKKESDDWERYQASLDSTKKDPDSIWLAGSPACPKQENGDETFEAWMYEQRKMPDGTWKDQEKYYHFVGKSKDSLLTEASIFPSEERATADITKAQVQFIFTKGDKPTLQSIRYRQKSDKGEFLPVLITDKDTDIPITLREENDRMKALAAGAQGWVDSCRRFARAAKVAPKQTAEALRIMQQQVDAPTSKVEATK